jgi:AcrR family transcriptional regulator
MRAIAAEVGIAVGAIYHYVPDKQTLLVDMMSAHLDALLAAWDAADPGGDAVARLGAFARFHIGFHLDRRDAVAVAYGELRALDAAGFERIEGLRRAYEAVPEGILREGAAEGTMRVPDVRLAGMALIAMLTGVGTWYRDGGRLTRADVAAIHADMALGMVGARPGP